MRGLPGIPGPPKSAEVSAFLEKGAVLLLAPFLVSLAAFFQNQVLCKTGSRKSAEFGGKSAEFRGSRFQHVGVFGWRFLGFSAEISAAGTFRQKVLPCFSFYSMEDVRPTCMNKRMDRASFTARCFNSSDSTSNSAVVQRITFLSALRYVTQPGSSWRLPLGDVV